MFWQAVCVPKRNGRRSLLHRLLSRLGAPETWKAVDRKTGLSGSMSQLAPVDRKWHAYVTLSDYSMGWAPQF